MRPCALHPTPAKPRPTRCSSPTLHAPKSFSGGTHPSWRAPCVTMLLVAISGPRHQSPHHSLCCVHSKVFTPAPAGLLNLLPIPRLSWCHIVVGFVTGLPPLDGHTVILIIADRFSKAAHFVPLSRLPSTAETGDLLDQHIFWLYGIPRDIFLDRGPQFTSRVWQDFCTALGATVSLSSGYHRQSNCLTRKPKPGERN